MMFTYLAICIIMFPVNYVLNNGPGPRFSLGNLGFVEPKCY